jgi:hypothetical protein
VEKPVPASTLNVSTKAVEKWLLMVVLSVDGI